MRWTSEAGGQKSRTQFCEIATAAEPMQLANGDRLGPITMAYETYGELDADGTNAVLVFHALTGSHHASGYDPIGPGCALWTEDCHTGWWNEFLGPGKPIDTTKFFVICANYLGSCYGSTGPMSPMPRTTDATADRDRLVLADEKPYGSRFPWPTIRDFVDSNARLLDRLGIERVHAVIGGSVGGFCATDFALRYSERVGVVIPIASGFRATELARAMNFEQIYAIESDPDFRGGDYYDGPRPHRGLCLARMIGHKTFVALRTAKPRAKQRVVQPAGELNAYVLKHSVESYMLHQGRKFVARFDANSYLRIMHAWQSFDAAEHVEGGDLIAALRRCQHQRWMLFSIDSDFCFFPEEQAEMAAALRTADLPVSYITVHSDKGHDAFLLEPALFGPHLRWILDPLRH